jgi:hypothetical protein
LGLNGRSQGGVGIFRQINEGCLAGLECFSELFCPHNKAFSGQFRQIPALGDHTIFHSVHTKSYYIHILEKVNKFYGNFLDF